MFSRVGSGTSDWVDEDRGSSDDIAKADISEYGGGGSGESEARGGSGGGPFGRFEAARSGDVMAGRAVSGYKGSNTGKIHTECSVDVDIGLMKWKPGSSSRGLARLARIEGQVGDARWWGLNLHYTNTLGTSRDLQLQDAVAKQVRVTSTMRNLHGTI